MRCTNLSAAINKTGRRATAVGSALLLTAALSAVTPYCAQAKQPEYTFKAIAFLGHRAPGGGTFVNDFEPGGLNSQGDIAFGADVSTGGEGVFLGTDEQITQLTRTGDGAPRGGMFDAGFLGPVALNDLGDMAFDFLLSPFTIPPPLGVNAGAYRYSQATGKVTAVVTPFVTRVPGGGTFQGVSFQPTINGPEDIAFAGIIKTDKGIHVPGEAYIGLGVGIFRADVKAHITKVVVPGDAAPTSSKFDWTVEPWINDFGDVSFIGHIAGEEAVNPDFPPQAEQINALGSVYVKRSATGTIRSIAHSGDVAPGGGKFRQAFHDVMNNRGDIAFFGDLTPPPAANKNIGMFLYSDGKVTAIARPGDPMPGGGKLLNASLVNGNVHINNPGDVVFSGVLDTMGGDVFPDTGLFKWSDGELGLIARTGTLIHGVGTVEVLASLETVFPPTLNFSTNSGAINNDAGQVLFCATMTNGKVVLLLATPEDE